MKSCFRNSIYLFFSLYFAATAHSSSQLEVGESKAHTYHWLHTFDQLGQLKVSNELTSDYPSALVFEKEGVLTYIIYNFSSQPLSVSFSNGKIITASPNSFTVEKD